MYSTAHTTYIVAYCRLTIVNSSCMVYIRKKNRTSKHKIWVISKSKYSLWTEEATVGAHASLDYCTQPSAAVQRLSLREFAEKTLENLRKKLRQKTTKNATKSAE